MRPPPERRAGAIRNTPHRNTLHEFSDMSPPIREPQSARSAAAGGGARKRLSSDDLFGDAQEILIDHAGQEYRLRITRQDKLILTK
jgi:hemin uptake protein HemP